MNDVPFGAGQSLENDLLFPLFQGQGFDLLSDGGFPYFLLELFGLNPLIRGECDGPLDLVSELSDIPRPCEIPQYFRGLGRKPFHLLSLGNRAAFDEMGDQQGDIISAIAQWRQMNFRPFNPIVEVFSKVFALNQIF